MHCQPSAPPAERAQWRVRRPALCRVNAVCRPFSRKRRGNDMVLAVLCPSCDWELRVPESYVGRRVMCPNCNRPLRVRRPILDPAADADGGNATAKEEVTLALSVQLGIVALALGLVSIMILCVPFVGYASIVLSGIGVSLGFGGLFLSWREKTVRSRPEARAGKKTGDNDSRGVNYPLAGIAACLVALALV